IYKVGYGFFNNKGQMMSTENYDYVQATDSNEQTLLSILNNNNKSRGGLTTKILSVSNVSQAQGNVLT
ncbi:MAG TPA: hypothetical protein VKU42_02960, partial [Candidatus Angelobacter sp.]|nr:hypothetical protein [Candidatus Angelobacter sp.]